MKRNTIRKPLQILGAAILMLGLLTAANPAFAKTCPNGRNNVGAIFLSILHPGLGEYHLNGYGDWNENMPTNKFWFGFIPIFGTPYLSIVSAIDAANCRTDDNLRWKD